MVKDASLLQLQLWLRLRVVLFLEIKKIDKMPVNHKAGLNLTIHLEIKRSLPFSIRSEKSQTNDGSIVRKIIIIKIMNDDDFMVSFVKQKHLTFTDLQLVKCEGFDAFSLSYDS